MTSIQDWSKWNRMYGNPNVSMAKSASKKDESKELRSSIQMAEKNGYFLNLDSDFLLNEFGPPKPVVSEAEIERQKLAQMLQSYGSTKEDKDRQRIKEFLQISYINLGSRHLRVLGPIEFCRNLRILVLSNNYLTQIDALVQCKHLTKLDLHGNQLSQLPSLSMWANLRWLQVLFLHDNPIAKRSAVHGLTGCRRLAYLTLFDTPISLKRNYRHHMVNNVVSLKALDHYVISDEEIIEDVSFGAARFATFHPALRIRPLEDDPKNKDLSIAEELLRRQLSQIAQVLKHSSPVVIVQRFARGWLARRRTRPPGQPGRLATTLTQQTATVAGQKPPPPSRTSAMRSVAPPTSVGNLTEGDKTQIDFDDYVKGLDESSREAAASPGHRQLEAVRASLDQAAKASQMTSMLETLDRQSEELDWAIAAGAAAGSAEAPPGTPVGRMSARQPLPPVPHQHQQQQSVSAGAPPKFGPVMPTVEEDDEHLPMGSFRLVLVASYVDEGSYMDAYAQMVLGRARDARFARDAELDYHQATDAAVTTSVSVPVPTHNDWHLLRRGQGTMSTAALARWARLEDDLERERRALDLAERALIVQTERDHAKLNVAAWRSEKRAAARAVEVERVARVEREFDRARRAERKETGAEARKRSVRAMQRQKQRGDRAFAVGFVAQQNSIGTALKRHDFQAIRDSRQLANREAARAELEAQREARDSVQHYMQEQRDRRQAEMSVQRAVIDAHVLADMNDRLKEAYSRVAHLKTLRRTLVELSAASAPVPDHPDRLTADDFRGATPWDAQVMVQDGRVGGHPPVRYH
uniref:Leucine-rich repeat-containing protein 51 n=1 Tax=Macrostomum lignano TaxID=282301 RepID=A0A1I8GI78_9PLAT